MFRKSAVVAVALASLAGLAVVAHGAPATGPVVKDYGPVFPVPPGSFNLAPDIVYKVSMDVSEIADFPEDRNRNLESAARFLNMHARNGIKPDNIQFALIVHGPATRDLLTDAAYRGRFEEDNPNTGLLQGLRDAGVKIYLCSQSAAYMRFAEQDFNPAVTMAVSAMTAHVRLQQEGYTLIPF
jgi:intracellular sulfur oxidation DsrE/DsrF family protein